MPSGVHKNPEGKHGGYRKRDGDHYVYWYPNGHKGQDHLDWQDDVGAGIGTALLHPGHFVALVGEVGGLFAWTPDAREEADDAFTTVTPVDPDSGRPKGRPRRVRKDKVQAQRSFDRSKMSKKPKPKKKEPKWKTRHDPRKLKEREQRRQSTGSGRVPQTGRASVEYAAQRAAIVDREELRKELVAKIAEAEEMLGRTGRRRLRSPDRIAAIKFALSAAKSRLQQLKNEITPVGTLSDTPSRLIQGAVFDGSTARKGTVLHKLENGGYPLVEFSGDEHFEHQRKTHGTLLPPQDVEAAFNEFSDIITGGEKKAARTYRINSPAEMEDLRQGAKLGFMLSLRMYSGGVPFEVHARRVVNVYAALAARDIKSGGAAMIPTRQMQMVHGFIAARARAAAKHGSTPTPEQIAKSWHLTKKATFTGRDATLGSYERGKKKDGSPRIINQASEQVPLDSWQVRTMDGTETGKGYPGKLDLVETMDKILDGSRVEDSDWMNEHEGQITPQGSDPTLPQGARYALREQIESILTEMPPRQAEVITVIYGLNAHDDFPTDTVADPDVQRRIKDENLAMRAEDISDMLGLAPPTASIRDKQRKVKPVVDHAKATFRSVAEQMGYRHVSDRSRNWGQVITNPFRSEPIAAPTGPTHREMSERFGGDDKLAIYGAAVRAGNGEKVAKQLEKWKEGSLSSRERELVLRDYQEQRDKERLEAFRRQTATVAIDPSQVSDLDTGTPSESDWLYADEIMAGTARAIVSGGDAPSKDRPTRPSAIWSDERFHRFMGRERQYERFKETQKARNKTKQGGDNG